MKAKEIDDCEQCPLKGEFCKGGWTASPSGNPIEPPCTSWDPEEDIDDIYSSYSASQLAREEYEDRKWEEEKAAEIKRKKRLERAHQSRMATYSETRQISRLRRQIGKSLKFLSFVRGFSQAVSLTNDMFGYENAPPVEKPKHPLEIQNEKYEQEIQELDKIRKEKLKQLRQSRK